MTDKLPSALAAASSASPHWGHRETPLSQGHPPGYKVASSNSPDSPTALGPAMFLAGCVGISLWVLQPPALLGRVRESRGCVCVYSLVAVESDRVIRSSLHLHPTRAYQTLINHNVLVVYQSQVMDKSSEPGSRDPCAQWFGHRLDSCFPHHSSSLEIFPPQIG